MRWDLIDKFEVLRKGEYSRAYKKFKGTEDFFKEHLPGFPRVPEPLFLEMIAQAGGVLYGLNEDYKKDIILAKITQAEFGAPVVPPCELVVEAKIDEEREEAAWVSGSVKKGSDIVARANIMLVTMALEPGKDEGIVFNNHFLKTYDIRNVAAQSGSSS